VSDLTPRQGPEAHRPLRRHNGPPPPGTPGGDNTSAPPGLWLPVSTGAAALVAEGLRHASERNDGGGKGRDHTDTPLPSRQLDATAMPYNGHDGPPPLPCQVVRQQEEGA
jgi:hypothetical protein